MQFTLTKTNPRPLARCGAMVAPGRDNRWRGVKANKVDTMRRHEAQMRARPGHSTNR